MSILNIEDLMNLKKTLFLVSFYSGFAYGCHCDDSVGSSPCDMYDMVVRARATLAKMGNSYDNEPTTAGAPLAPELVLNTYWRELENKPQEEKDEALKKILDTSFSDEGYRIKRYHLAAAALIGANLNREDWYSPLCIAAIMQDASLCALLLNNGADPNWKRGMQQAPLYKVKTRTLAQLFIDAGAQLNTNDSTTLLHYAMNKDYDPLLVKLYIQKGIHPLTKTSYNKTPLHCLADEAYLMPLENLKEKVQYLFETLDTQEIKELIEAEYSTANGTKSAWTFLRERNYEECRWLYNDLKARLSAASKKHKLS